MRFISCTTSFILDTPPPPSVKLRGDSPLDAAGPAEPDPGAAPLLKGGLPPFDAAGPVEPDPGAAPLLRGGPRGKDQAAALGRGRGSCHQTIQNAAPPQ